MPKDKRRFKSVFRDFTQGAKSAGKATAQSAKTTGVVASQRAKSIGETTMQGVKAAGDTAAQKSEAAKDAVTQSVKSVGDVATQGARAAGVKVGPARQRVPWDSVLPEQARNSLAATIESSKSLSGSAKRKLIAQMGPALGRLSTDDKSVQAQAFAIIQSSLSSPQISREINDWLQSLVVGRATIYDKAMDARFI